MRKISMGVVTVALLALASGEEEKAKDEVQAPADPPLVKPVRPRDSEVPEPTHLPTEPAGVEPRVVALIRKAEEAERIMLAKRKENYIKGVKRLADDEAVVAALARMQEIDREMSDWKGSPFDEEQIAAYRKRRDLRLEIRKVEEKLGMSEPIAEAYARITAEQEKRRAELNKAELGWHSVESGVWLKMMRK